MDVRLALSNEPSSSSNPFSKASDEMRRVLFIYFFKFIYSFTATERVQGQNKTKTKARRYKTPNLEEDDLLRFFLQYRK